MCSAPGPWNTTISGLSWRERILDKTGGSDDFILELINTARWAGDQSDFASIRDPGTGCLVARAFRLVGSQSTGRSIMYSFVALVEG